MKRIRFIYGAMLLVLALAMNACDDYYSVAVAGDPGVTPVVLTTPEESITLPAKDAAGEVEIVTNMENSKGSRCLYRRRWGGRLYQRICCLSGG